jgi:N6-adenosine-specific RNA methylase IME4
MTYPVGEWQRPPQLYQGSCTDLMATLAPGSVAFVHLDPPWDYDNDGVHAAARNHYDGLPVLVIASHMRAAYDLAADNAYCAVWCTFPKLQEWASLDTFTTQWQYITGCAWGKTNGLGVGFHVRGDAEILLLYKKGQPKPQATTSNLWLAPRIGHSEKPQNALRALVSMATQEGDTVLDLYAGASASLARACRALGRNYVGAEIDPARHAEALQRLALEEQTEMQWGVVEDVA